MPDPEVPERPARRRFTAEYKLHIVEAANAATEPGEVGALLRREGPVQQPPRRLAPPVPGRGAVESGEAAGPTEVPPPGGRERAPQSPGEPARAAPRERIIEIQGEVSELLGIPLARSCDDDESGS